MISHRAGVYHQPITASTRRRILAALRAAHRVLGVKRGKLAIGLALGGSLVAIAATTPAIAAPDLSVSGPSVGVILPTTPNPGWIDITDTGSIVSPGTAISGSTPWTITNAGTIQTPNGMVFNLNLADGSRVTNTGTIAGGDITLVANGAVDVTNYNTMTGDNTVIVEFYNGSTSANRAIIDNYGTIRVIPRDPPVDNTNYYGGRDAIYIEASGTADITNEAGAVIDGYKSGVVFLGTGSSLVNAGAIIGETSYRGAVRMDRGGIVSNLEGGIITGRIGVSSDMDPWTPNATAFIANAGTIEGTDGATGIGILLGDGGFVGNYATGTITGSSGTAIASHQGTTNAALVVTQGTIDGDVVLEGSNNIFAMWGGTMNGVLNMGDSSMYGWLASAGITVAGDHNTAEFDGIDDSNLAGITAMSGGDGAGGNNLLAFVDGSTVSWKTSWTNWNRVEVQTGSHLNLDADIALGNAQTLGTNTGIYIDPDSQLTINFANPGTLATTLSGEGAVAVTGPNAVTITGANAALSGRWQIDGTVAVDPASNNSETNLGTATVDIATAGTVYVRSAGSYLFANPLTGSGTLNASTRGNAFDFADSTGPAFTGTVALKDATFLLDGNGANTAAVSNATLRVDIGSVVTVAEGVHTIGNLVFNGGTVAFDAIAPAQIDASSQLGIRTGELDVRGGGAVQFILPADFGVAYPAPANILDFLNQDDIHQGTRLLVDAVHVTGSVDDLVLEDQSGNAITDSRTVDLSQAGNVVAVATYDYKLTTGSHNDGLYVGYELTHVDLLGSDQPLVLTEPEGASGAPADISATLNGSGSLIVAANNVLSISGDNTFSGGTSLVSGTLLIANQNALGTGGLAMAEGTTVDFASSYTIGNDVTLAGDPTFNVNAGLTVTMTGAISDAPPPAAPGVLEKIGAGTLILSGANTYSGSTDVMAGTLRAGATTGFSHNSAFTVAHGATLALAGYNQNIAGLTNGGTVTTSASASSAPGTVLTVAGDYAGDSGTLVLNSVLGDSASATDRLVVNGSTAGTTTLRVNNIGGLGAMTTGDGIEVVTVGGASNGTFTLANGPLQAGAFEYTLGKGTLAGDTSNWYLASDYRASVPVETAASAVASRFGRMMLGGGAGDLVGTSCLGNANRRDELCGSGIWGRMVGLSGSAGDSRNSPSRFASDGPAYDYGMFGLQAGIGLLAERYPSGASDVMGVLAGYGHSDSDISGARGGLAGSLALDGYQLGAYWSHHGASGWYVNGAVQFTRIAAGTSSVEHAVSHFTGLTDDVSLDGGYPVALGGDDTLTPQIQLAYQHISLGDALDAVSNAHFTDSNTGFARFGLQWTHDFALDSGAVLSGWLRGNVVTGFGADALTTITTRNGSNPVQLRAPLGDDRGELDLGLTYRPSSALAFDLAGIYGSAIDGSHGNAVGGEMRVSYRW